MLTIFKKGRPRPSTFPAKNGVGGQPKNMPIVMYLGREVNEYEKESAKIIDRALFKGDIRCELCLRPLAKHSNYVRNTKETREEITIIMVWCSKCRKWHALLPDFLLPHKHYSGNEIESVIIESETTPVNQIDTEASELTVRRWIKQIGERIEQAVSKLKYHFGREGRAVNEVEIDAGHCFSELEQVLAMAPLAVKYSGNKLGLANIWLGTCGVVEFI